MLGPTRVHSFAFTHTRSLPRVHSLAHLNRLPDEWTSLRFYGICVKECPKAKDWTCDATGEATLKTLGFTTTATKATKLNACKTKLEASSGFTNSLSMLNTYISASSMIPR